MNCFTKVIILGTVIIAGMGYANQDAVAEESIPEINRLLKNEKGELDSLKARIKKQERTLSIVGARESSHLKKLRHLGDRLKMKERELKIYKWNIKINERKISDLEKSLKSTQSRLARQRKGLAERLRTIYKEGNLFPIKVLFSSENINDLMQRIKYMETVATYDSTLFRQYENRLMVLQDERESLLGARAKLIRLEKAALEKQGEIKKEKQDKSDFLKKLKREKKLNEKVRQELVQASRKLNDLIFKLEEKLILGDGLDISDKKGHLDMPVKGRILNKFGKKRDEHYSSYIVYNGINVKAPKGSPVRAVFAGKVLFAGALEGYGNLIIIGHGNEYHSLYGHLDEILIQLGKPVRMGQIIARSGDTGSLVGETLYFELRHKGKPIEPTRWFQLAKR